MNIIFVTHGILSLLYLDLLSLLKQKLTLDHVGFYVNTKSMYAQCLKELRSLNLKVKFIKGWEISSIVDQKVDKVDFEFLKKLEKEFGEPFLWNVLVMDRRVYNGILTKYKQDYAPRFNHDEMLHLLQKGFRSVLDFIDRIKPDIIIGGFTPVTYIEYIFYLCAKAKGIKYINLTSTKIRNYLTFSEEIYRELPHIEDDYRDYLKKGHEDHFIKKASAYLQTKDKRYEGTVIALPKFSCKAWGFNLLKLPFGIGSYYLKKKYLENELRGSHWGYFFKNIYNPIKYEMLYRFFPYYPLEKLKQIEYAYYPLHVEPEIALSLFGREYLNQIELIRNIAKSIPVTWKLAVKDHPAGVGRRNIRYYKKLLEIPNVILVNQHVDSTYVIQNAKMIFTVSGFSGFEATFQQKPVITFGKTFYSILPEHMVRKVQSLENLPFVVNELMRDYKYSERDLISLVAAIMKNSVQVNLYVKILKKQNRVKGDDQLLDEQKRELADFLLRQLK